MSIELALTPDGRWDVSVEELTSAARGAGFAAVGLPAGLAGEAARAAYAAQGLRCHELLALMVSSREEATLESAARLASAAAAVGAEWVLTVFRSPLTDETAAIISRCAAMFAEAGAGMAVEFSPLGPIRTVALGLEVVAAAGPERAGIMIDSWHFSFSDSTWEDLAAVPLERIAYLQFTDAPVPESEDLMRETMERRLLPGDGTLELERFASTFRDRGWSGLVSLEVLNAELCRLPVPEFARRAHDAAARYWL